MNNTCICKLIPPGSLISVRTEYEHAWSQNIVYSCCEEYIDIPLVPNLMKSCPFVGTCVAIKFKNEYFEYIIHGSISRVELCGSPTIRIHDLHIFENKNQRLFPRLDVYLPATLSIKNNDTYYCSVSNISLGGVAFLSNKEIPQNTECEVNILIDDQNTIFVKGIILRCSHINLLMEYSVKFTFMDEENSNYLYSFLHSIDTSYDSLRAKYICGSIENQSSN